MAVFNRQNKAGTIGYAKFDMDNSQYHILEKPTLLSEQRTRTSVQLKSCLPAQCTKREKKRKKKISQFEMHFTASSTNIRHYRNFNAAFALLIQLVRRFIS